METFEQKIRLIIDQGEEEVHAAIGLTEAQFEQIAGEVLRLYKEQPKITSVMKAITETYTNDAELTIALYELGALVTRAHCPLHRIFGEFEP